MSKRTADFDDNTNGDNLSNLPTKQFVSSYEQEKFLNIHSFQELEEKTLNIQNKKLSEHVIDQKQEINTLKERIEQLEDRQTKDNELIYIVNRYWNILDEDGQVLLKRLDGESVQVSESAEYFLKQLASWDKEQLEEKLKERVQFSKRIISRLVEVIDKNDVGSLKLKKHDNVKHEKISTNEVPNNKVPDLISLETENERLKRCCSDLQGDHHVLKHENLELKDKIENCSMGAEEWKAKYNNMEYCLAESIRDYNRMNRWLTETNEKNKALKEEIFILKGGSTGSEDDLDGPSAMAKSKVKELMEELEDSKELAARRLTELEKLGKKFLEAMEEITKLKLHIQDTPENVILESVQYKSLYAQFNILYSEAVTLQTQLEEATDTLLTNRQHHFKQIEEMELNESLIQNQMRSEMIAMTEEFSKLRFEYESLELELKQTICHNQQTVPIASEMRSLIDTLRSQGNQAKTEVQRLRKKYKDLHSSYEKLKEENANLEKEYVVMTDKMKIVSIMGKKDLSINDEVIKDLQRELLRFPTPDSEQLRKNKKMEDTLKDYKQKLALAKQQEDAMVNDSTVTIQAYEDVLEQNSRLLETLKEKDENNLKLMTDRMKANQTTKLLREDQHLLEEQVKMYKTQVEAFNRSLMKQEEKERLFLNNITILEKESNARQQALAIHKRTAMEYQQTADDLRMNLQKYTNQLAESQTSLQEKASAQAKESFKHHRIKDEQLILRRKYERLKRLEHSSNTDEGLMAELQTYKDTLTCSACKSNKKDAILTKCFHVFCHSCLKTRYEIRNRKCPKCNATFGANDYHHIYMS